jgi:hypothetical protein
LTANSQTLPPGGFEGLLTASVLASYEAERRPLVAYAQMEADRQRSIMISQNPVIAWARTRAMKYSVRAPRAMKRVMEFLAGGGAPLSPTEDLLCNAAFIFPTLDHLLPAR